MNFRRGKGCLIELCSCVFHRSSVLNFSLFVSLFAGGLGASVILGGLDPSKYLGILMSYLDPVLLSSERSRFMRCWHAKTDGSASSKFKSNCNGKGPTVTIIKVGNYIFGGYTDVSWTSKYLSDVFFFFFFFSVS